MNGSWDQQIVKTVCLSVCWLDYTFIKFVEKSKLNVIQYQQSRQQKKKENILKKEYKTTFKYTMCILDGPILDLRITITYA